MSIYPNNYRWIGNTLSYDLAPEATGLWIEFKKPGTTEWLTVFKDINTAPQQCPMDTGTYGTVGEIRASGSVGDEFPPFPPPQAIQNERPPE